MSVEQMIWLRCKYHQKQPTLNIQCNPFQSSNIFLRKQKKKKILNSMPWRTANRQNNPEKEQSWRTHIIWSWDLLRICCTQKRLWYCHKGRHIDNGIEKRTDKSILKKKRKENWKSKLIYMIKYVQQSINTIQQGKVSFSTNGPWKTGYPFGKE